MRKHFIVCYRCKKSEEMKEERAVPPSWESVRIPDLVNKGHGKYEDFCFSCIEELFPPSIENSAV